MNDFIQEVLAVTAFIIAIGYFLYKKFVPTTKKSKKNCGDDNCGCH